MNRYIYEGGSFRRNSERYDERVKGEAVYRLHSRRFESITKEEFQALKAAVWGESDDSCHRGGSAVEKAKRKKFETESFSTFCSEAIRLQYTLYTY